VRQAPALALQAILAAGLVWPAAAADLTVHVDNVRNHLGKVFISVFNTPQSWLDEDRTFADTTVPASTDRISVIFKDLPPGRYAVVTFHDENDNGRFDQNFLGLPLEGYAFSRNVRPFLSAPRFEDAAIDLGGEDRETVIRMVY
jgi:uncharacterized protein (DUF2141 family)